MKKLHPLISYEQRKGIKKLLEWCVQGYKKCDNPTSKRMWRNRIDLMARLQRQQSYNNFDKKAFNLIREEYYRLKE